MFFTKSRLYSTTGYEYTLNSKVINENLSETFDIFLSHSYADRYYIARLKNVLESYGFTVYVDWITDGMKLSRSNVTKETAEKIRQSMRHSKSMIVATSSNSPNSKWIPWELGCFDGLRNSKIAILPIMDNSNDTFIGQEYLSLYPIITEEQVQGLNTKTLWVNESRNDYSTLKKWIND